MIILLYHSGAMAQNRKGAELYHYSGSGGMLSSLSSRAWYQTNEKWYGEIRYNYEQEETFACSVGKTFMKEGDWTYAVTPVAGASVGKQEGLSFGMNGYMSHRALSISSSVQYGISPGGRRSNLFSWSEVDWQLSKKFFAGVTLQQTGVGPAHSKWDPGMQIGFNSKKWSLPLYVFQPASGGRYFVVGILFNE
jgi:hypothetical protein